MLLVRALEPDDWETKRELRLQALVDAPEAFGGSYDEAVNRSEADWRAWPRNGRVFAAIAEDKPVGMACGWLDPEHPDVTTLIGMWVAPPARGADVARSLIDAVAGFARQHGSQAVELNVYDINPRAHRAYLKCGFTDSHRTHLGKPGVTMRYALDTRTLDTRTMDAV